MKSIKKLMFLAIAVVSSITIYPVTTFASEEDKYITVANVSYDKNYFEEQQKIENSKYGNTALDKFLKENPIIEDDNKNKDIIVNKPIEKDINNKDTRIKRFWDTSEKYVGWIHKGNDWYYCEEDGYFKTGWIYNNGNWYYLSTTFGSMITDRYVDGYYVGANGAWTNNITNARVSEESVQATKAMKEKVEALGCWVQKGDFIDSEVEFRLPDLADGSVVNTECIIKDGVATVRWVTSYQNFKDWSTNKSPDKYINLTVDEYMKYKEEGKIGKFYFYSYIPQAGNDIDNRQYECTEYLIK